MKSRKKNIEMQHLNWNSILEANVATDLGRWEFYVLISLKNKQQSSPNLKLFRVLVFTLSTAMTF